MINLFQICDVAEKQEICVFREGGNARITDARATWTKPDVKCCTTLSPRGQSEKCNMCQLFHYTCKP